MISAFMGTPGSGKSLHAAELILSWLKSGRTVITNFPVNVAACGRLPASACCISLPSEYITPGYLWRFALEYHDLKSRREKQTLLVLDEVGQMFDPRALMQRDAASVLYARRCWCQWFPVSRKLRYEVVLIAQDFHSQVDKQIYAQCEVDVFHRAVKYMGFPYNLISWLCGGLFQAMYKVRRQRVELQREFFRFHRRFGCLYDTFDLFCGSDFVGPPEPPEYTRVQLQSFCSADNAFALRLVS